MNKINIQKLLRCFSYLIIIVGGFVGYDLGDKMLVINHSISYVFDFSSALFVWFVACYLSILLYSIAKIIDILENK